MAYWNSNSDLEYMYGLRDPLDSVQTSGDEYLIDVLGSHNALQQLHKRKEGLKMCNFYSFIPFK